MRISDPNMFQPGEVHFAPPDSHRGGDGGGDDEKKNKKPRSTPRRSPEEKIKGTKLAEPTQAIIDDTKDTVFARVWEEKKQFVRDALIQRFGIDGDSERGSTYIASVVNGITNTGLFEDITNRGVGAIYANLSSGNEEILEQLIERGFRVMTYEQQLEHYANYAVRRKVMGVERLDEYIQFLREEVYFTPSAQEYDRWVEEINTLIDELKKSPLRRPRKLEIWRLLLEKSKHVSEKVIRKK